MELSNSWKIQSVIGSLHIGSEISTTKLVEASGVIRVRTIDAVEKMDCVIKKTGEKPIAGYRKPNMYRRAFLPSSDCALCLFEQSGTSGCILRIKVFNSV